MVSTVYGEEPAYAVYVPVMPGGSPLDKEAAARQKYASFNAVMFRAKAIPCPITATVTAGSGYGT